MRTQTQTDPTLTAKISLKETFAKAWSIFVHLTKSCSVGEGDIKKRAKLQYLHFLRLLKNLQEWQSSLDTCLG